MAIILPSSSLLISHHHNGKHGSHDLHTNDHHRKQTTNRGYDLNAIEDDYIDVPPRSLGAVRSNLRVVQEILDPDKSEHKVAVFSRCCILCVCYGLHATPPSHVQSLVCMFVFLFSYCGVNALFFLLFLARVVISTYILQVNELISMLKRVICPRIDGFLLKIKTVCLNSVRTEQSVIV